MLVWIIEIGEPLSGIDGDVRDWHCGMLAKTLVAKGHRVKWWTSTFDHMTKRHRFNRTCSVEMTPGLQARLLQSPGYARNISPQRLWHHIVTARAFACEASTSDKPNVVFCSLPTIELAEQAVKYGKRTSVPVVIDIADLWPDHYLTLAPPQLRGLFKAVLFSEFRRVRRILQGATGITAISQTFLNWGLNYAGRPPRKADGVFPMGYPSVSFSPEQINAKQTSLSAQYGLKSNDFIVTFVGTFVSSFDLQTVIKVARAFEQIGRKNVRFVLVGDGDNRQKLRELAQGLGNVIFTGWFDQVSIRAVLNLTSVGLAPYRDDASMSLPNKPFEYMATGLPLLSSLRGELETLICDEKIGLQYQAGDANSLAEQIRWLASHHDERLAMGRRARKLFENRFSADIIYPELVRHLEKIAGQ